MADTFVLISEHGEYEDFTRDILGVFSSQESATAAIPRFQELCDRQWKLHQEYDRHRNEYLAARFTPSMVYPSGLLVYTNAQYEQVDATIGPRPSLVSAGVDGYKYVIEPFNRDVIEVR